MSADLLSILAKAHRAVGEGEPIVFGAKVEILTEPVVARGDLGGASPLGLPAVALPAILDKFAPQSGRRRSPICRTWCLRLLLWRRKASA